VHGNAETKGNIDVATEYVDYLYSAEGQPIAAKNNYRPRNPELANPEDDERFPQLETFTIRDVFGSWKDEQTKHFNDGGVFDAIYGL
jgi:sulfate transport system substrate-binding protein